MSHTDEGTESIFLRINSEQTSFTCPPEKRFGGPQNRVDLAATK